MFEIIYMDTLLCISHCPLRPQNNKPLIQTLKSISASLHLYFGLYSGHTIVGDYTYSNREDITPYRMMLHASSLHLPAAHLGDIKIMAPDPFHSDSNWVSSVDQLERRQ